MRVKIYRVKEGKLPELLSWAKVLSNERREEAIETLVEEGLSRETLAYFQINNQYYVLGFVDGEERPATKKEINHVHKEVMRDCLEFESSAEIAYDLFV